MLPLPPPTGKAIAAYLAQALCRSTSLEKISSP
jgi:hypothetical protein